MAIDIGNLISEMKTAASAILNKDLDSVKGFSSRQIKAIAQQAAFIEKGILSGEITDETREFFLDSLEKMALNFVKTLQGILIVTIEKIWNAIVSVLYTALESATGIPIGGNT